VRIVNRRERWAKWTLLGAVVGAPVLYVLSFGPACWLFSPTVPLDSLVASVMNSVTGRTYSGCAHAPDIYWPLGWAVDHMGEIPSDMLGWYGRVGLPHQTAVMIPASHDGSRKVLR
jgi:hypothetical protein